MIQAQVHPPGLQRPAGTFAGRPAAPDGSSLPDNWLAAFLEQARSVRHVSASTLEAYALDILAIYRWARARDLEPLALDRADLERYVADRRAGGLTATTLARQLSSCRRFFAFLIEHGALDRNPAAGLRVDPAPRRRPARLEPAVVHGLLHPQPRNGLTPVERYRLLRDQAILNLLAHTSLGVSEVRLLCWHDVSLPDQVVRLPAGNGTWRTVWPGRETMAALARLRQARAAWGGPDTSAAAGFCFTGVSGFPLSRQALCHMVRKWGQECGAPRVVTPSLLRRAALGRSVSMPRPARDA